jgi:hypothetical protein
MDLDCFVGNKSKPVWPGKIYSGKFPLYREIMIDHPGLTVYQKLGGFDTRCHLRSLCCIAWKTGDRTAKLLSRFLGILDTLLKIVIRYPLEMVLPGWFFPS